MANCCSQNVVAYFVANGNSFSVRAITFVLEAACERSAVMRFTKSGDVKITIASCNDNMFLIHALYSSDVCFDGMSK